MLLEFEQKPEQRITIVFVQAGSRFVEDQNGSIAQNRAVIIGMLLTLPCLAAFFIIPGTLMRAPNFSAWMTARSASSALSAACRSG